MFTGIIQEIGKIKSLTRQGTSLAIEVESRKVVARLELGASVSINGACQTVIAIGGHGRRTSSPASRSFTVLAVAETLSRTNLGELRPGSPVNLEHPLSLSDSLHGHLVQGHVDCVSRIAEIRPLDGSVLFEIEYPTGYEKFLIEKGSVGVDGVSLTVVAVAPSTFQISMIPHTIENTIFKYRKVGDRVNLEFDMIAKYIQKMIAPGSGEGKITMEFLKEHGF
jgi:riboflavin synthase